MQICTYQANYDLLSQKTWKSHTNSPTLLNVKTTLDSAQTLQIASVEANKPFGQQVKKKEYLKILEIWGVLSFNQSFKRQTDIYFSQKHCADVEIANRIMGSSSCAFLYLSLTLLQFTVKTDQKQSQVWRK